MTVCDPSPPQIRLKEAVRPLATDTLRALAKRTADVAKLSEVAHAFRAVLDGSAEGKIKVGVKVCLILLTLLILLPRPHALLLTLLPHPRVRLLVAPSGWRLPHVPLFSPATSS